MSRMFVLWDKRIAIACFHKVSRPKRSAGTFMCFEGTTTPSHYGLANGVPWCTAERVYSKIENMTFDIAFHSAPLKLGSRLNVV